MSDTKKAPNDVDRHVGTRIRMRRTMLGMSQEKLGEALGITFQQVQKYEKGTNRVSASRLQQISTTLGVTIDYFYAGAEAATAGAGGFAEGAAAPYEADILTGESLKLLRSFNKIRDARVRRKLAELAAAIAGSSDE
ncbi:helix-turn-helix domain-containing protein [Enterovirga rhinocerotis]|uniref:Transcriptional regulator with XRE-family HTH domain n=1 Tax=Enterovirga rhinocerotis TaxID=1339210 RepID=A0A4R7BRR7_9HYPH|nr:helix-turn-helix transcriptional regulator [Enterovirga rhinocerotis]TDR87155.1 transcriptional regulator with XRE-family HTH domain [Enterovirga rhinocerotis]